MADLYVASTGSNTAPYDTWAKAATTPATAINAAAAGDTVYVHGEDFTLGADTTWTLAGSLTAPVKIICSNDKANAPPQTLATSFRQVQTTGTFDLIINGVGYIYGFTYACTGTSAGAANLSVAQTDDDFIVMESCGYTLNPNQTSATSALSFGSSSTLNNEVKLKNFTCTLGGATGQGIQVLTYVTWEGGTISGGSNYTSIFGGIGKHGNLKLAGVDLSGLTGTTTLFNPASYTNIKFQAEMSNCKLDTGCTTVGAFTGVSQLEVNLFNCAIGDTHYEFEHYTERGTTTMVTSPYSNTGATYDGTNHVTWKIVTTANATFHHPYVSPWIEKYWSATSAISPYFDILRDGSATAYKDNEVWAEFSAQANTGFTLVSFVDDRCGLLTTAANQTTSSLGAGDWTGENATAWFGKIGAVSITPAEIGMLRGRICVGVASSTVYIDPTIRT